MYSIGQKFIGKYPPMAAVWCNQNGAVIAKLDTGEYEIQALPVQPEPTIDEQNAVISEKRASEYARLIDPLHAEKTRKTVLGEWTEELELEYVAQVKALTKQIQDEHPYIVAAETVEQEPETAEQINKTVDTDAENA